jgi:hypothetical protein
MSVAKPIDNISSVLIAVAVAIEAFSYVLKPERVGRFDVPVWPSRRRKRLPTLVRRLGTPRSSESATVVEVTAKGWFPIMRASNVQTIKQLVVRRLRHFLISLQVLRTGQVAANCPLKKRRSKEASLSGNAAIRNRAARRTSVAARYSPQLIRVRHARPGQRLHRRAGSWTVMKKPPRDCRAAK